MAVQTYFLLYHSDSDNKVLTTDTWNFKIYDDWAEVKKILTGKTSIRYSNLGISQSCVHAHVSYSLLSVLELK